MPLRSALEALRANPTRSILTTLGVIIGVAAVILVVAIGSGARDLVVSRIKSLAPNLLRSRARRRHRGRRAHVRCRRVT